MGHFIGVAKPGGAYLFHICKGLYYLCWQADRQADQNLNFGIFLNSISGCL